MWPATLPITLRLIDGDEAVEQRVARDDQQAAEEDDAADDDRLEPAREQVAERDLRDHAERGEPGSHTGAPGRARRPSAGDTRSTNLPSARRTIALACDITF